MNVSAIFPFPLIFNRDECLPFRNSFDSNILIRTLLRKDALLRLHAGCGIVADSDPEAEADELDWKLLPLLEALR